jgi:hypothetical protein
MAVPIATQDQLLPKIPSPVTSTKKDKTYTDTLIDTFTADCELLESIKSKAASDDFVSDDKQKLEHHAEIILTIAKISKEIAKFGFQDVVSLGHKQRKKEAKAISDKITSLGNSFESDGLIHVDYKLREAPSKLLEALNFCVVGDDRPKNGPKKFNAILHDIHNDIIFPHTELCKKTYQEQAINQNYIDREFTPLTYRNFKDFFLTQLAKKVQKNLGTKQTDPRDDEEFKKQLNHANDALLKKAYLKELGHDVGDTELINVYDLNIAPDLNEEERRRYETAVGIINDKFDSLLSSFEKDEFERKSHKIKRCFDQFAEDIDRANDESAELYKFRVFYYLVMLASPVGPFNLIFGFADILSIPGFSELLGKLLEPLFDGNIETLGDAMVKGSAEISEVTKIFTELGRLLMDNIPGVSDVAGAAKNFAEIGDNFMGNQLDVALESMGAYNIIFDSILTSIVAIFAFGNEAQLKESRNKIDKELSRSVESIVKKSEFNAHDQERIAQEVDKIYKDFMNHTVADQTHEKQRELIKLLKIDQDNIKDKDDLEGVIKNELTKKIYAKLSKFVTIDKAPCPEIKGGVAQPLEKEKGITALAPAA